MKPMTTLSNKPHQSFLILLLLHTTTNILPSVHSTKIGRAEYLSTRTNVDNYAALSLDISSILNAQNNSGDGNQFPSADKSIYDNGENAGTFTLAKLANNAPAGVFDGVPSFLYHVQGLMENDTSAVTADPLKGYAGAYIDGLWDTLPENVPEAALVLSVWMQVASKLNDAVVKCRGARLSEEEGLLDDANLSIRDLEQAMGLWFGDPSDVGSLISLSRLADSVAVAFGGSAIVNSQIKQLYEDSLEILLQPDRCYPHSDTDEQLFHKVHEIISAMTIPLLQGLIRALVTNDASAKELYTLAVVPRLTACHPHTATGLLTLTTTASMNSNAMIVALLQSTYSCLGVTCGDIGTFSMPEVVLCKDPGESAPLGEYTPMSNVFGLSKIDLDVRQFSILVQSGAFQAAEMLYSYGHNAYNEETEEYISLSSLATSHDRVNAKPFYGYFVTFTKSATYAHNTVIQALNAQGPYDGMSPDQRGAIATATVQYQILYMASLAKLKKSASECESYDDTKTALQEWDKGVALLLGSSGGSLEGLPHLADTLCSSFGTCEGEDNDEYSNMSSNLMFLCREGITSLVSRAPCQSVTFLSDRIAHLVLLPLFQEIMRLAWDISENQWGRTSVAVARGDAVTRSVLPLVQQYEPLSGEVLQNYMLLDGDDEYNFLGAQVDQYQMIADAKLQLVADAIYAVTDEFGLECEDVGVPEGMNMTLGAVCDSDSGTPLAGHFLMTRSNVDTQANIALDVKDMMFHLQNSDFDKAKDVYRYGKNSELFNNIGSPMGKRTLQSLSTTASSQYTNDATFCYHLTGIANTNTLRKDYLETYATYANQYVLRLLSDTDSGTLAAEATVALHLWMRTAHELHDALDECYGAEFIEGDTVYFIDDNELGARAIDEAMAYWIGSGQWRGDDYRHDGYSMFALAEDAYQNFNDEYLVVSPVNSNMKEIYEDVYTILSNPDACTPGSGTAKQLYYLVNDMLNTMRIPLMQKLLQAIVTENIDRVRLYSLAIVPQIAACQPSTAAILMAKLYYNDYDTSDRTEVISLLQHSYSCLGFSCDDIGSDPGNNLAKCADPPDDLHLAGYAPSTPVRSLSMIDLDILQIQILTEVGNFNAAHMLYRWGKNALDGDQKRISLQYLASTDERDKAVDPFFRYFVKYHFDTDYADTTISNALEGTGDFSNATNVTRAVYVTKTLQYQVMYMAALTKLGIAHTLCSENDENEVVDDVYSDLTAASQAWDEGVAFLIGSMEGFKEKGAPLSDGMLFYNLANKRCSQFGTCNDDDELARLMVYFGQLIIAGQKAVKTNNCEEVQVNSEVIAHLVMIPVMQSVLRYAILLVDGKDKYTSMVYMDAEEQNMANGKVMALSILPIIKAYNEEASRIIETNMLPSPFPGSSINMNDIVQDGPQAIANAFYSVMSDFGVSCSFVGESEGVRVCPKGFFHWGEDGGTVGTAGGEGVGMQVWLPPVIIAVVATLCLGGVLLIKGNI